jgi:multiple antibiotic resistance protein
MGQFIEMFLQHTITFFAILDPIGASAIMLSLLHTDIAKKEINIIAYRVTLTITVAFFVILIGGNFILQAFGIDSNSLKVMGGIVLIITALNMVRGSSESKALTKEENKDIKVQEDLSIIPIAIPITFGPGIFSTIIILKEHANGVLLDIVAIVLAFIINAILVYVVFKNSIYIKQYLGLTGQNIITKLMGLIVGAIAVQFIISGAISLSQIYLN